MGATTFYESIACKKTDHKKAFKYLVEASQYEYGHGGYSGTIAEKSGYSMSSKPKQIDPEEWIELLNDFDEDDTDQKHYYELESDFNIYDDKWSDALCIETNIGFIFCGSASC